MKSFKTTRFYLRKVYNKLSLGGKRTTLGYGLALVVMAMFSITSYQNADRLNQSAAEIRKTQMAFLVLSDITAVLIDAESAMPGYFLLDDPAEIERDRLAVDTLYDQIDKLRPYLNSTESQAQLEQIETLVKQRVRLLRQIKADDRLKASLTAEHPISVEIQRNRQEVRYLLDRLRTEENSIIRNYLEEARQNLRSHLFIEQGGMLLTFFLLLGVYVMLRRQKIGRERAEAGRLVLMQQKALTDLKLQFFSMVSHEFRTPLSLITGSAQLLNESLKPVVEPTKLKNLQRIQASAKLMSQMLNDVLMIARADAGKLDFNPTLLELQTFCLNLVEDMQVFSNPKRSIKFSHQGQITHASLDEKLLYSLLSNLLANALKYSASHTPIYFHLLSEPHQMTFQVQDFGIGIAPEDLPDLYNPFTRGSNTKSTLGSGLGLTVVKRCVEMHDGEILVESAIDQGTTFTVVLPRK